jgi:hypothetical protein
MEARRSLDQFHHEDSETYGTLVNHSIDTALNQQESKAENHTPQIGAQFSALNSYSAAGLATLFLFSFP